LYVLVAAIGPASAVPPDLPGWDVAWFDEFAGNQLNTSLWTPIFSTNPTNNSLHAYLPSQVAVAGGNLVITSTNQPYQGLPYRSGQVISKVEQQYGKWEVRAKLPTTAGQWPAIWLLPRTGTYPWPSQGEIDIMENRGDEPHRTSSAFHWGTNPPYSHSFVYDEQSAHQDGQPENFHSEFHTYGVEWTDRQLRFFVDGVNHYTAHDADVGGFLSNQSANMETVINNAIGGDFLPDPNGSTVWPQQMLIDYVHVYSAAAVPAPLAHENGSFDQGQSPLAGWSTFGVTGIGNVQPHVEAVRSGTSSVKFFGQFNGTTNYSGIEQGITVAPGEEVRALMHELIRSADSIAGTGNELILKIDYYNERHGKFGSANYLGSDSVVVADGSTSNNVWLERELRSVAPAGAVEARMGIVFAQRANAGGAVHVDDTVFGLRGQNVLTWDENGDGLWASDGWLGAGPEIPTDFETAVIRSDRVTVGGNYSAFATIVESGALNVSGELTSDVAILSDGSIVNRGTIAGDLAWQGQLAIESVRTLTVDGTATVEDGILSIAPIYSQPRGTYTGDFVLVDADTLVGALAQASAAHLSDGLFLNNLTTNATQIIVDLYSALPGDANGDGSVDGSDFIIWNMFKFQAGTDWTSGDFNGDGVTDGTDFVIWNQNKFTTAERSVPVPEPQGLIWVVLGAVGCFCRHRR
jgi:beta-glucanase (GH16 family)